MSENRKQILEMLSQGKITAAEAERLITAVEKPAEKSASSSSGEATGLPKYLRVLVESEEPNSPSKVNVRIPMQLLTAGVKLVSLIPVQAREHVNQALKENGVQVDLTQLKPEHLEDLVEQLKDLTVDVDDRQTRVKVFCE